jgi:hypothetical protein
MKLSALLGLIVISLGAAACGEGGSDAPDAWNCSTEARAEPYTAGMNRTSTSGIKVAIMESTPAPPARGDNVWRLSITDAQDVAMEGMVVTVFPWMPDHGHGTSAVAQIADIGQGEYTLDPVNLWMAGYWEITITVGDGVTEAEEVVFELCTNA